MEKMNVSNELKLEKRLSEEDLAMQVKFKAISSVVGNVSMMNTFGDSNIEMKWFGIERISFAIPILQMSRRSPFSCHSYKLGNV